LLESNSVDEIDNIELFKIEDTIGGEEDDDSEI